MDDGVGGVVAFVGGINPDQTYWDTSAHDSLDRGRVEWEYPYPLKWLEKNPPLHDISTGLRDPQFATFLLISSNVTMAQVSPMQT